jgi:hypothetical protein
MTMTVGLALYQLTSLALGPVEQRELQVSFDIPAVDFDQFSQPVIDRVDLVVGMVAPAMPQGAARPTAQRAASPPAAVTSMPAPVPVTAEPAPVAVTVVPGAPTTVGIISKPTDYHDADARSLRLARGR